MPNQITIRRIRRTAYTIADLERAALKDHDSNRASAIAATLTLKGETLAPGVTRIHGDLCNVHGRWGSCSKAGYGGSKRVAPKKLTEAPKGRAGGKGSKGRAAAKPKLTEAQKRQAQEAKRQERAAAHTAEQEQHRKDVLAKLGIAPDGQQALEALRNGEQPDAGAIARGGFVKAGLVEQAQDGSYRMTASGRALLTAADAGDAGRAGGTISGARDRTTARSTRQEAAAQRTRDAAAKRAAAAGKKPKAGSAAQPKQPTPRQPRLPRASGGRAAPAGGGGSSGGAAAKPATPQLPQQLRDAVQALSDGQTIDQQTSDLLVRNGLARIVKGQLVLTASGQRAIRTKAFAVFKDASGQYRWIARTTTAYRDRDGEIISVKALEDDAARMTATGQYGPLRYWHVGQPDPFNVDAPWGPGLDIGNCDYSIVIGRTNIESGTFKSAEIGAAFAETADGHELSPGFFHAAGEPDARGVFTHIRRFERSTVPTKHGRASNLFTGLTVKEHRMDQATYKQRVDAFLEFAREKGIPPEAAAAPIVAMEQADKDATDRKIAYKEARPILDVFKSFFAPDEPTTKEEPAPVAEPAPEPVAADPIAELTATVKALQVEVAALKAGPPPMDAEAEMQADMPMEEEAAAPVEEEAGGLTLSAEDLTAFGQIIAPIVERLDTLAAAMDVVKAMGAHVEKFNTALGSYAKTKDDTEAQRDAEVATLKAKLAELLGDQPRTGYRPSLATDNTLAQVLAAAVTKESAANGKPQPTPQDPFADLAYELLPGARPQ